MINKNENSCNIHELFTVIAFGLRTSFHVEKERNTEFIHKLYKISA